MSLPPEVLFHRYFQSRPRLIRDGYLGKADLDHLRPQTLPVSLLESLQEMLNEALRQENTAIAEHVDHDPFHFDYVESAEPNALAFCSDGYSFIGVTIPLLEQLWRACVRLSESADVVSALAVPAKTEQGDLATAAQRIQVALFRLQLFFVVLHEYTHVVHGHVTRQTLEEGFPREVLIDERGSLERQAREADADCYAVYYVLASVIGGAEERAHLLDMLGLSENPPDEQDQLLLRAFILAVGAFLFIRPPQALTVAGAYQLTHPPQAARMNLVMKAVTSWCAQNRIALVAWITLERFQASMRAIAAATWGMNGGQDWSEQTRFLQSEPGRVYFRKLDDCLIQEVKALGTR
jgi:hypothetical protein